MCKTYQRRINTNLPNYELKDLYIEYFKLTFYSPIHFMIKVLKFIRIKIVINLLAKKYTLINNIIQSNELINVVLARI